LDSEKPHSVFIVLNRCSWPLAAVLALAFQGQAVSQLIHQEKKNVLPDTVRMGFERVLNTFVWNGYIGLALEDSNSSLTLSQGLRSKLIRANPTSVQGEYDGFAGFRSGIGSGWNVLARTSSLVVSDNQSIDLGRLAQHQGLVGLGYASSPWNIGMLGGYEFDAQERENDQGPVFDAYLEGSGLRLEEIRATILSEWTKSYLGKRSPEQQGASISLNRDFGGGDGDSLSVRYSRQRREFYTSADQGTKDLYNVDYNIFRRDAVSFDVSNQLTYHMSGSTSIAARGSIQNRTIDRGFLYKNVLQPTSVTLDSRIQELILNGTVSLSSQMFDWMSGDLGMSFEERDDRFGVIDQAGIPSSVLQSQEQSAKRLEYTSRRTSLWVSIVGNVSSSDSLAVNGSASILRYDTPDSLNTDDRDELLLTMSLRETHRFSKYLTAGLEANVTLGHLVYLDRLQSANNNWNRVISLSPSVSLSPFGWLVSDNTGEVVANYTVYDFEEQVASVKSYSFRQASWSDSTTVALSRDIDLEFSGIFRLYERGILRWKEFKEKPLDYFIEKSGWPRLTYRALESVSLSVGYRYFSRDQYAYAGEAKTLTHSIVTAGPTVGVQWYGRNGTQVIVTGWRETSTNDSNVTMAVSNLSISVNLMF
jgi:hypothetical protein